MAEKFTDLHGKWLKTKDTIKNLVKEMDAPITK